MSDCNSEIIEPNYNSEDEGIIKKDKYHNNMVQNDKIIG